MIIVADASVLVGEMLRRRGRELLTHSDLRVVVAEDQWTETRHEFPRRLDAMVDQRRITRDQADRLRNAAEVLFRNRTIDVVPRDIYGGNEETARRRVPRDPNDWAPVALAIALDAGILTGDNDFLGCGCPTWTVDTLRAELGLD